MSNQHPLDQTLKLTSASANQDGNQTFKGQILPAYGNMIGPYGGVIAAILLKALLQNEKHKGDPLSMTINFAAPLDNNEIEIATQLVRDNKSSQHWNLTLSQNGQIAVTASAVFSLQRQSWADQELPMPQVPAADTLKPLPTTGMPAWVANYDMRMIKGLITLQPGHQSDDSTRTLWVRDNPPRPLDFPALLAISDCFFPCIFVRKQQLVPTGTITLTTYFHATQDELVAQGDNYLLASARANRFHNGFSDQTGHIWSAAGELLVSTHQLVYFKA